jgi:hypothetical protein
MLRDALACSVLHVDVELAVEILTFGSPTGITWYVARTSMDNGSVSDTFFIGPVPEPGSMRLLGTGVLGLAGMLRRKINL